VTTPDELAIGHRVRVHDLLFPFALETVTILDRAVGHTGATALAVLDRTRTHRVVSPGRVHALADPDDLASCAWCAYRQVLARTATGRPLPDHESSGSPPLTEEARPRWMKMRAARVPARST
jgi:hypothetical protein